MPITTGDEDTANTEHIDDTDSEDDARHYEEEPHNDEDNEQDEDAIEFEMEMPVIWPAVNLDYIEAADGSMQHKKAILISFCRAGKPSRWLNMDSVSGMGSLQVNLILQNMVSSDSQTERQRLNTRKLTERGRIKKQTVVMCLLPTPPAKYQTNLNETTAFESKTLGPLRFWLIPH